MHAGAGTRICRCLFVVLVPISKRQIGRNDHTDGAEREMAPLRPGDRKLHRLTAASPLGRQFALMGKMETRRRREDESGRILGNVPGLKVQMIKRERK